MFSIFLLSTLCSCLVVPSIFKYSRRVNDILSFYNGQIGTSSSRFSIIPSEFDWREKYPECVVPVQSQGSCGSCYAFSIAGHLSHRFCQHKKINVSISPQVIVDCDGASRGCEYGLTLTALWYIKYFGIVEDECYPYRVNSTTCPRMFLKENEDIICSGSGEGSSNSNERFFARNVKWLRNNELVIMEEIWRNGPVVASFRIFNDFNLFDYSKVYSHTSGDFDTWHAIQIVGWGVESDGTKYWLCENSWGTWFGIYGGYFKILRGENECGIESLVFSGYPTLEKSGDVFYWEAFLLLFAVALFPLAWNVICCIPCCLACCWGWTRVRKRKGRTALFGGYGNEKGREKEVEMVAEEEDNVI